MATYHTVEQGEYLSLIARRYDFQDHRILWDDPHNAELRALRGSPNVLYPGDVLYVPTRQDKAVSCATGRRHRFRRHGIGPRLRLVLLDESGAPRPGLPCTVSIEGDALHLVSGGDGLVDRELPEEARDGDVTFDGQRFPIRIGHLDPVEADSGVRARLVNLGYYRGSAREPDDDEMRSAIEEFQCDQELPVTGACDPGTRVRLRQVHGA